MVKGDILKMKNQIIKGFSLCFSIFFIVILFNTIFFNKTVSISYNIPVMIVGSILISWIVFAIYIVYHKKKFKFLKYKPRVSEIIVFLFIIFLLQYVFAKLTHATHGWDCGMIIGNAFYLLKGFDFNTAYFSGFTNNIGLHLLIYLM